MTKKEAYNIALNQLALEYDCNPADFAKSECLILPAVDVEGRRLFRETVPFFRMATFGTNTIISTNPDMFSFLYKYVENKRWEWLFEEHNLIPINDELMKYGHKLSYSVHSCLPETNIINVNTRENVTVKWFNGENEISQFFPNEIYPNALSHGDKPNKLRPDIIAVCSYNDDKKITGIAGASIDTPLLWQIGIDIEPDYRGTGLGTYLVTLLKNEIIKLGKVPYYSTTSANIPSKRIAYNAHFYPAWTEIISEPIT